MTQRPDLTQLSPRHIECLVGVVRLKSSKEIAGELGLTKGTVDNYLADATRLLGARDRRDAARIMTEGGFGLEPSNSHMNFVGVGSSGSNPTALPQLKGWPSGPLQLPLRQGPDNELSFTQRLAWISGIALAFAIGFGMLAVGFTVIGEFAVKFLGISR